VWKSFKKWRFSLRALEMKDILRYVKPVMQAACCLLIPILAWAQMTQENKTPEPPASHVILFERMGGYLGIHDTIRVYPDGTAINEAGKRARVPPDTVNEWLKKIYSVKERSTPEGFLAQEYCMDCYVYQITAYQKDGTKICLPWSSLTGDPDNSETGLAKMGAQLLKLRWK
jgi:hypothetical protein